MAFENHKPVGEFRTSFTELEIGPDGEAQIREALEMVGALSGDQLDDVLMDHFAALKDTGELRGINTISEWARAEDHQNEPALVIKALPGVEAMTDSERYRIAVAQTALVSNALGTPWSRHYENGGQRIQHVKPDPNHQEVEGSIGAVPLWPHNEILPTAKGEIICSEFSTLFAVHNKQEVELATPTTLYDAQRAIGNLSPAALEILTQTNPPRIRYNGTEIEKEDVATSGKKAAGTLLPVLRAVRGEDGNVLSYDLVADLDGKTMDGVDPEATAALVELRDRMVEQEIEYVIPEGTLFVWRNRKALHGRRPVKDLDRHLVRSQIGETEYAEHTLAA